GTSAYSNPGSAAAGSITWTGNNTTPANVVISGPSAITVTKGAINLTISGMTLSGTGSPASGLGYGIAVNAASQVVFNKIVFASCNAAQIFASFTGRVTLATGGSYQINGGAPQHLNEQGGFMTIDGGTVT